LDLPLSGLQSWLAYREKDLASAGRDKSMPRQPDATSILVATRTRLTTQRSVLGNVHPTTRYFIIFESF
jgi:hypothetical protein